MPKAIDLTGQVFGRLTVIGLSERRVPATGRLAREHGSTLRLWECRCACGNVVYVTVSRLRSGGTTSCSCAQRDLARAAGILATSHVWPRTCLACGRDFWGTTKQIYCCRACKEADKVRLPLTPSQKTAAAKIQSAWKNRRAQIQLLKTQEALRDRSTTTD